MGVTWYLAGGINRDLIGHGEYGEWGYLVVDVKCMLFQNTLFVSYYRIELPSNS